MYILHSNLLLRVKKKIYIYLYNKIKVLITFKYNNIVLISANNYLKIFHYFYIFSKYF